MTLTAWIQKYIQRRKKHHWLLWMLEACMLLSPQKTQLEMQLNINTVREVVLVCALIQRLNNNIRGSAGPSYCWSGEWNLPCKKKGWIPFWGGVFMQKGISDSEIRDKKRIRGCMSTFCWLGRLGRSQDHVALSQGCCCWVYHADFLLVVNLCDGYKVVIAILGLFYHGW